MDPTIKLLLVDDDDINLYILNKIVEHSGYSVELTSMTSSLAGIAYLNEIIAKDGQFPDIIFVDLNMPVQNGWDFLIAYEQLSIKKNIRLYMLTSSIFDSDIEDSKSYPILSGYYFKPITMGQIRNLFEETIKLNSSNTQIDKPTDINYV